MKTLVLIIIILILFIFLFNVSKRLRGGEYHSFTIDGTSFTPSISQLKLTPTFRPFTISQVPANTPQSLFIKCANELRKRAKLKFDDKNAYFNTMNEAHLISDANADLLALLLNRVHIDYAFAVCEWHGRKFKAEMNSLITFYNGSSLKIERGDSFKWLHAPYANFASYTSKNDIKELEEVNDALALDVDIESLTVDEIRDKRLSIIRKYDSKRLNDVIAATDISKKLLKEVQINALNGIIQSVQEFIRTKSYPRVDIYLEYSYNKERANVIYVPIHKHTLRVLSYLLSRENMNRDIYCFRFKIDSLDYNYETIDELVINHRRIFIYDNTDYNTVQIPKTKESFAFDEALFIHKDGINYAIQIEHSEDGSSHKSNFVEALARMTEDETAIDTISIFRATHYLNPNTTTFICNLKKEHINIKESVIYKAFDTRAKTLFGI